MRCKVVLFAADHFSDFPAAGLQLCDLLQSLWFLSVANLVPEGGHPLCQGRFLFAVQSMSQIP